MEQQDFKKEEKVDELLKIVFTADDLPKDKNIILSVGNVNKAFKTIVKMYNSNAKSRSFVYLLIKNFYQIDPFSKVLNFSEDDIKQHLNKDCVIGINLIGLAEMSKYWADFATQRMFIIAQCSVDKREMNDEEKLKLKKIIDKMPVEARTTSFGYFPKYSYFKKYLSKESVIALNKFVDYLLGIVDGNNNKELMKCLNMYDSYFEHKSPKQKTESAPKSNGFTMNNFLSEEQINKLKGIK